MLQRPPAELINTLNPWCSAGGRTTSNEEDAEAAAAAAATTPPPDTPTVTVIPSVASLMPQQPGAEVAGPYCLRRPAAAASTAAAGAGAGVQLGGVEVAGPYCFKPPPPAAAAAAGDRASKVIEVVGVEVAGPYCLRPLPASTHFLTSHPLELISSTEEELVTHPPVTPGTKALVPALGLGSVFSGDLEKLRGFMRVQGRVPNPYETAGRFAAHCRWEWRKGFLGLAEVAALEALPGWKWDARLDWEQEVPFSKRAREVGRVMEERGMGWREVMAATEAPGAAAVATAAVAEKRAAVTVAPAAAGRVMAQLQQQQQGEVVEVEYIVGKEGGLLDEVGKCSAVAETPFGPSEPFLSWVLEFTQERSSTSPSSSAAAPAAPAAAAAGSRSASAAPAAPAAPAAGVEGVSGADGVAVEVLEAGLWLRYVVEGYRAGVLSKAADALVVREVPGWVWEDVVPSPAEAVQQAVQQQGQERVWVPHPRTVAELGDWSGGEGEEGVGRGDEARVDRTQEGADSHAAAAAAAGSGREGAGGDPAGTAMEPAGAGEKGKGGVGSVPLIQGFIGVVPKQGWGVVVAKSWEGAAAGELPTGWGPLGELVGEGGGKGVGKQPPAAAATDRDGGVAVGGIAGDVEAGPSALEAAFAALSAGVQENNSSGGGGGLEGGVREEENDGEEVVGVYKQDRTPTAAAAAAGFSGTAAAAAGPEAAAAAVADSAGMAVAEVRLQGELAAEVVREALLAEEAASRAAGAAERAHAAHEAMQHVGKWTKKPLQQQQQQGEGCGSSVAAAGGSLAAAGGVIGEGVDVEALTKARERKAEIEAEFKKQVAEQFAYYEAQGVSEEHIPHLSVPWYDEAMDEVQDAEWRALGIFDQIYSDRSWEDQRGMGDLEDEEERTAWLMEGDSRKAMEVVDMYAAIEEAVAAEAAATAAHAELEFELALDEAKVAEGAVGKGEEGAAAAAVVIAEAEAEGLIAEAKAAEAVASAAEEAAAAVIAEAVAAEALAMAAEAHTQDLISEAKAAETAAATAAEDVAHAVATAAATAAATADDDSVVSAVAAEAAAVMAAEAVAAVIEEAKAAEAVAAAAEANAAEAIAESMVTAVAAAGGLTAGNAAAGGAAGSPAGDVVVVRGEAAAGDVYAAVADQLKATASDAAATAAAAVAAQGVKAAVASAAGAKAGAVAAAVGAATAGQAAAVASKLKGVADAKAAAVAGRVKGVVVGKVGAVAGAVKAAAEVAAAAGVHTLGEAAAVAGQGDVARTATAAGSGEGDKGSEVAATAAAGGDGVAIEVEFVAGKKLEEVKEEQEEVSFVVNEGTADVEYLVEEAKAAEAAAAAAEERARGAAKEARESAAAAGQEAGDAAEEVKGGIGRRVVGGGMEGGNRSEEGVIEVEWVGGKKQEAPQQEQEGGKEQKVVQQAEGITETESSTAAASVTGVVADASATAAAGTATSPAPATGALFEEGLTQLKGFLQQRGRLPMPFEAGGNGRIHLGAWVMRRQQNYASGRLTAAQVSALEEVPGWSWRREEQGLARGGVGAGFRVLGPVLGLKELEEFVRAHGRLPVARDLVGLKGKEGVTEGREGVNAKDVKLGAAGDVAKAEAEMVKDADKNAFKDEFAPEGGYEGEMIAGAGEKEGKEVEGSSDISVGKKGASREVQLGVGDVALALASAAAAGAWVALVEDEEVGRATAAAGGGKGAVAGEATKPPATATAATNPSAVVPPPAAAAPKAASAAGAVEVAAAGDGVEGRGVERKSDLGLLRHIGVSDVALALALAQLDGPADATASTDKADKAEPPVASSAATDGVSDHAARSASATAAGAAAAMDKEQVVKEANVAPKAAPGNATRAPTATPSAKPSAAAGSRSKGFMPRVRVRAGGSVPVEWLSSKAEDKRAELTARAKQARKDLKFKQQVEERKGQQGGEVVGEKEGLMGDGYAMDFPGAFKAAAAAGDAAKGAAASDTNIEGFSDKYTATAADGDAAAGEGQRGFTLEVQRDSPGASPDVLPSENFRDFVRRQRGGVRRVVGKGPRSWQGGRAEKLAWEAVRKEMDALGKGNSSSSDRDSAAAAAPGAAPTTGVDKDVGVKLNAGVGEGAGVGVKGKDNNCTTSNKGGSSSSNGMEKKVVGGVSSGAGAGPDVLEAAAAGDVSLGAAEPFMGWVRESLDVAGVEEGELQQMLMGAAARLDEEMMEEWGKWTYTRNFKP